MEPHCGIRKRTRIWKVAAETLTDENRGGSKLHALRQRSKICRRISTNRFFIDCSRERIIISYYHNIILTVIILCRRCETNLLIASGPIRHDTPMMVSRGLGTCPAARQGRMHKVTNTYYLQVACKNKQICPRAPLRPLCRNYNQNKIYCILFSHNMGTEEIWKNPGNTLVEITAIMIFITF